jgi:hypothetical protein
METTDRRMGSKIKELKVPTELDACPWPTKVLATGSVKLVCSMDSTASRTCSSELDSSPLLSRRTHKASGKIKTWELLQK